MPGHKQPLDKDLLKATGKCKWRLFISHGFRADGKPNRITPTIGPCSERQAEKKLQELFLEFTKKPPQNANRITFESFAKIWLVRRKPSLSPNTYSGYESVINARLVPYFGHIYLNKISVDIVKEYFNNLKTFGERLDGHTGFIAPGTIHQAFRTLRAMLNSAVSWNYLPSNPVNEIPKEERPKPHYKKKPILQENDLSTLLQELDNLKDNYTNVKNKLFFHLAFHTGCRSGELIALTYKDINCKSKIIHITKDIYTENGVTLVKNSTKSGDSHYVHIDDKAIELLNKHKTFQEEWLKTHHMENPEQYLFLKRPNNKKSKPKAELPERESFYRFLQRFLKKNGLPRMDVHGCRRTAASYSLGNQVPLTDIQAMLGHKSLSTTMIYLRRLNTGGKQSAETLAAAYQQLTGNGKVKGPPEDEGSQSNNKNNP